MFIKKYNKYNLLDSSKEIEFRINFINHHTKKDTTVPKTTILINGDFLIYKQEKIKSISKKTFLKEDFFSLARSFTQLNDNGFIHGDINRKNIKWTNSGFKILDLEPSLMQRKNNLECFMITSPYYSTLDIENKKLSVATDKIGFTFFLLRSLNKISVSEIIDFSKNRNFKKYTGFHEKEITDLNYFELINFTFNLKVENNMKIWSESMS